MYMSWKDVESIKNWKYGNNVNEMCVGTSMFATFTVTAVRKSCLFLPLFLSPGLQVPPTLLPIRAWIEQGYLSFIKNGEKKSLPAEFLARGINSLGSAQREGGGIENAL